jgi:hypothetical protein
MPDTLRERIAQALRDDVYDESILDAILPVVEQEIQQEREKWHAEHEGPWWVSELANEGYEAKREVERQQAAMQQFSEWLTVRDNMWMERAHHDRHGEGDMCDEHHIELVDVRAEFHDVLAAAMRETPPPPQEPQDPRYKHILSGDYYMPGHKDETKESRDPMTKPDPIIDVQTTLDDWLASNPEAQKYVRKIYYVPDGAQIPRDVTHMNRLTSIDYPDLELRLGVVATLETAALANLILGMIERSAPDPKA